MAGFFVDSFQGWMEYQRQVALTKTQVDGFSASLQDIGDMGLRIANEIPVAFQDIQPALFDIFSSTNANLKQSEILLEGFSKAAVAGQTDIQIAARGTIAIMNAYNIPLENVNHILDIQFELVRKGVGTYAEFAKVFGRVVPSATRAGQSFETVAAMLAYMTRNGQSAAMASTSAARALDAFSHPKSVKKLEKLGVKMRDVKGNMLPLVDILDQFRTKLLKMPTKDRVEAILDVFKGAGGTIQARRFIEQILLRPGELEDFKSMLKSMEDASGVMGEKYSEMADTAASKTQLLSNKWEVLKTKVGEAAAPAIIKVIDLFSQLLDKFNKLDPKTRQMIVNIGLISAALFIVGGILLVVVGGFVMLAGAIAVVTPEMLVVAAAIAGIIAGLILFGVKAKEAYEKSKPFRNFINGIKEDLIEFRDKLAVVGEEIKKAWDEKVVPAFERLRKKVEEDVLPVLDRFRREVWDVMMPKIVEAARIIKDMLVWAFGIAADVIDKVIIPSLQWLAEWWDKNKEEMEPIIWLLGQIIKWALILGVVLLGVLVIAIIALLLPFAMLVAAIILVVEVFKLIKGVVKWFWDLYTGINTTLWKIRNDITRWALGLIDDFLMFGSNMMTALIAGIKSKFSAITSVMNTVTGMIDSFMQHSPAKRGPLSGRGYTFYSGQSVAGALAAGMQSKLADVQNASNQLALAALPGGTPSSGYYAPVAQYGATLGASTDTNARGPINITVHTQEIDPRSTAAELGWEIDGRL
jgi:TP901 family phage tail tape measure protein